ncbi:hypothetical protein ACFE04_024498 [Oxalis oulophora]
MNDQQVLSFEKKKKKLSLKSVRIIIVDQHSQGKIAIRCYQTQSDANNVVEGSFPRRDFLKCTGAAISMELISSSGPFVETTSAADLIQRRRLSQFQRSRLLELEKDYVSMFPSSMSLIRRPLLLFKLKKEETMSTSPIKSLCYDTTAVNRKRKKNRQSENKIMIVL